jgi:hypothetical protein
MRIRNDLYSTFNCAFDPDPVYPSFKREAVKGFRGFGPKTVKTLYICL